jgi:hypothetical protein
MLFRKRHAEDEVWLNVAAGAVGGLLGSWTMNLFQAGLSRFQHQKQDSGQGEPATVQAAERVTEITTGRHLSAEQKKTAEPLVHYGFGTAVGAIYGLLAAKTSVARAGAGTVMVPRCGCWRTRLVCQPPACQNHPRKCHGPGICRRWPLIWCTA